MKRIRRERTTILAFVLLACTHSYAHAEPLLVPSGVQPGESYHLAFVTRSSFPAISSDIATYDAIVQGVADSAGIGVGSAIGDISWMVIGSTGTVDAIDHTDVLGAVFRVDDTRIAQNRVDLWDGGIENPLNVAADATVPPNTVVFTGTGTDGRAIVGTFYSPPREGGFLGAEVVVEANAFLTDNSWINLGQLNFATASGRLYAISEALVVPEPTEFVLELSALAALATLYRRRIATRAADRGVSSPSHRELTKLLFPGKRPSRCIVAGGDPA